MTDVRTSPERPRPAPRPPGGRALIVVALLALAAVICLTVLVRWLEGRPPWARPDAPSSFLERYLTAGGRVARWDQGGDTVSEGQAYAMLVAAATRDRDAFERAWRWTVRELRRSDGLFSWHWRDGRVVDAEPAADADLDIARALLVAAERFGVPRFAVEARRVAAAIMEHETMRFGDRLVLLPGPWARERAMANPSYFAPRTFSRLAAATGDARWSELIASSLAIVDETTSRGRELPPDWARLASNGHARGSGPPDDPGSDPLFRLDAPRVIVRFAEGCDARVRVRAARAAPLLAERVGGERGEPHALQLVAAAAAHRAAGDAERAEELLARAEESVERRPSYYGAAWVALGRIMLQSEDLGGCPA